MGKKTKYSFLLPVLILASLVTVSVAAGAENRKLISKSQAFLLQELSLRSLKEDDVYLRPHRILRIKTNDYGNYQPSPTLTKPPSKLIPN
ncbi:hypothetical protein HPP92_027307 [Vanilla planifolia]|uniref:Uncharacterized protein n=1 Tax=Vanilla planifolia TaxID=51239 RepID=A0A835PCB6_VANPL|nr:hypothetical protein HPP92_027307 [Vanilla planifolia]KAG0470491.1 hypothetical protein HPP92_017191 [Vanilla planifolia]